MQILMWGRVRRDDRPFRELRRIPQAYHDEMFNRTPSAPTPRCWIVLSALLSMAAGAVEAQSDATAIEGAEVVELLAALPEEGLGAWQHRRLARRPSRYRVVSEDGRSILRVDSYGGNSGIFRQLQLPADRVSAVAWRWRVAAPLHGNRREREKRGDDFAARVFVIFDAQEGPWSGRALCYVWSANQPVGSVYPSPYSDDVVMMVVESGSRRASSWVNIHRNVVQDYRAAFGTAPSLVTAVAIMVDTDNTAGRATAWFERLAVELSTRGPP